MKLGFGSRKQACPPPSAELAEATLSHGACSITLLTLYPGFHYFRQNIEGSDCHLAYVVTPTAWVGAAEPMAPEKHRLELIRRFVQAAANEHRAAVVLPVSGKLASEARTAGLYTIQIGDEPWFSLESFDAAQFLREVPVAQRLKAKGAVVEAFDPLTLSGRERSKLDDLTDDWLSSRDTVPLSFLNRVEPWVHVSHKRYFRALYHGQCVGMLAAMPVPARKGWYFADLLRTQASPVGTTELMIIEGMEQLRQEGAREVTLGLSPLAKVSDAERAHHPRSYRLLDAIYERSDAFYGFKTLFEYKNKFSVNRWEPRYLIAHQGLGPRALYGILRAMFPGGLIRTLAWTLFKKIRNWRPEQTYSKLLSLEIVPQSPPASLMECLARTKVTLGLAITNLLFFLASIGPSTNRIREGMEGRYSYTLKRLLHGGFSFGNWIALLLSSFLHWNSLHLIFNLITLILGAGLLEIVGGSAFMGGAYALGIVFSNPLNSLLLYPFVRFFRPDHLAFFMSDRDVGCSLGVFACLGALAHCMRHTAWLLTLVTIGIVATAFFCSDLMLLNHAPALFIGFLFGRYYARKN